ncbi:MAG TPA: hypothetical protein VK302_00090 [Terriglobales bacterium]|nr:hypothetical protein [Terriglobales bacterium]
MKTGYFSDAEFPDGEILKHGILQYRVITVKQPWATLIALGVKQQEFRSRNCTYRGRVIIHASTSWYHPTLHKIVTEHLAQFTDDPEFLLSTLFPVGTQVAYARIIDCIERGEHDFMLTLDNVWIIPRSYPVFTGLLSVPWTLTAQSAKNTDLKAAAEALAYARALEGQEKQDVYRAFRLLGLRAKINVWLRDNGLADFTMKARGGKQ